MLSIPEIASQIINKTLAENKDDCARTIFVVGSKSVVSLLCKCVNSIQLLFTSIDK